MINFDTKTFLSAENSNGIYTVNLSKFNLTNSLIIDNSLSNTISRIIIHIQDNEVGFLNGIIEVLGNPIDLILINPMGFQVDCLKMINIKNLIISTGILENNNFYITKGTIHIKNKGIKGINSSSFNFLGNIIKIDSKIGSGKEDIQIFSGLNTVLFSENFILRSISTTPSLEGQLAISSWGSLHGQNISIFDTTSIGVKCNSEVHSKNCSFKSLTNLSLNGCLHSNDLNIESENIQNFSFINSTKIFIKAKNKFFSYGEIKGSIITIINNIFQHSGTILGQNLEVNSKDLFNNNGIINLKENISLFSENDIFNNNLIKTSGYNINCNCKNLYNYSEISGPNIFFNLNILNNFLNANTGIINIKNINCNIKNSIDNFGNINTSGFNNHLTATIFNNFGNITFQNLNKTTFYIFKNFNNNGNIIGDSLQFNLTGSFNNNGKILANSIISYNYLNSLNK